MPTPIKYRISSTPEVPTSTTVKGTPLTSAEIDGNFKSLVDSVDAKIDSDDLAATGGSALIGFRQAGTGAADRTAQDKLREVVSVKDFGAVGDGVTDDSNAIQSAINAVSASGGGIVYFPQGIYYKPATSIAIVPKSNVTLRGAGMGATILKHDDTTGTNRYLGSISISDACSNFALEDLSFEGMWSPSLNSNGKQITELWYITNLRINNVEVRKSRAMGLTGRGCTGVYIDGCYIHETNADGVAFWDSSDVVVTNSRFVNCDDDCISIHTNDSSSAPLRNRVVITNNVISTSQGIKVLGAKNLVVSNNAMSRMYSYGLYVDYDTPFNQGNTPNHSCIITNNIINDVFLRAQGGNAEQYYMRIGGGQRNAGSLASAPGTNNTATGTIVSLFGSGTGYFQANNTDDASVSSPGGYFWIIKGNILARTLPAVANVADWGFGTLWAGNELSGEYTGAITESNLNTNGIVIEPNITRCLISDNIISTTGSSAIFFKVGSTPGNLIFRDFAIKNNKISDFSGFGVMWGGASLSCQDMVISGNEFDADPRFVNANRGSNGTWLASATPICVYAAFLSGAHIARNAFRNCAIAISEGGTAVNNKFDNIYHGDPASIGFSTSNKGIGTVVRAGAQARHIIEDSDPTSATFGQVLNTTLCDNNTIPTTGKYVPGHIVRCTNPSLGGSAGSQYVLSGWIRITLGSGHTINTDWRELRCLTGT